MKKILITLGATGGHIFPGVAIAKNLKKLDNKILVSFVNTKKIKVDLLDKYSTEKLFEIDSLGFKGKTFLGKIKAIFALLLSIIQSNKIINQFKPDVIIGTGGFVSLPVSICGYLKGVKIFIIEGNSVPGLSNKLIGKFSKKIFINFDETKKYFPKNKCITSGYPVREFFPKKSEKNKIDILILGGSQGSEVLNSKVLLAIQNMLEKVKERLIENGQKISLVHQTGISDNIRVKNYYKKLGDQYKFLEFETFEFIHNLEEYYSSSKILISRAGASTTSEVSQFPILPILVPIKTSTNNHQYLNAVELSNKKLAMIHLEDEENSILCNKVINLLFHEEISFVYKKSKEESNQKTSSVNTICNTILKEIT